MGNQKPPDVRLFSFIDPGVSTKQIGDTLCQENKKQSQARSLNGR